MIRPPWLAHAQALLARRHHHYHHLARRLLFTASKLSSPPPDSKAWDIAGNILRATAAATFPDNEPSDTTLTQRPSSRHRTTNKRPKEVKTKAGAHMLVVEGLPINLRASDFARLAARDLSDWQSAINEGSIQHFPTLPLPHNTNHPPVHQERDPWTLDPLGTYRISFSSQAASTVYRSKLDRLLKMAQHKHRSTTGLWTGTLPDHLRASSSSSSSPFSSPQPLSPEEEIDLFTLSPGTLPGTLTTHTSRVKGDWPWQRLLSRLVRRSGYAVEPAAVLVHCRDAPLSAAELDAAVRADARERDLPWDVASPYPLTSTLEDLNAKKDLAGSTRVAPLDDKAFHWKLRCRHVLVCKSPDVAWRFIRSWNQRIVDREHEGKTLQTRVTASYIDI